MSKDVKKADFKEGEEVVLIARGCFDGSYFDDDYDYPIGTYGRIVRYDPSDNTWFVRWNDHEDLWTDEDCFARSTPVTEEELKLVYKSFGVIKDEARIAMKVYELTNGSITEGLFVSQEAAQGFAQAKLDQYHAGWSPEDDESTETLITKQLNWSMQSTSLHIREVLTAIYGLENGTAFRIHEREVLE